MKILLLYITIFEIVFLCVGNNGAVGNFETCISEDSIFEEVDVLPIFPTGDLGEIRYWKEAKMETPKNSGHIIFSAIIEKDGSVTNVIIHSSPCSTEQNEYFISYVLSMPRWKPAMIQGVAVRYRMKRTLRFSRPQ